MDDKSKPSLYDGPILDSHVHFWDPIKTPREVSPLVKLLRWWPDTMEKIALAVFPKHAVLFYADAKYLLRPYLPEDYEKDCKGHRVEGIIHLQAAWNGNPVDETKWIDGLSSSIPIKGIVGFCDLSKRPSVVEKTLQGHKQASQRLVGIRYNIMWHPNKLVYREDAKEGIARTESFRESFALLSKYNLTFEVFCYSSQLDDITDLALTFPEQKILVDHMATPLGVGGSYASLGSTAEEREQILQDWKEKMTKLSKCPKVYIKISGLPMAATGFGFNEETATVDDLVTKIGPLVRHVIDAFGPQRCMIASNYAVEKVFVPLETSFTAYKAMVKDYPVDDQALLFGGSAAEFYGLEK